MRTRRSNDIKLFNAFFVIIGIFVTVITSGLLSFQVACIVYGDLIAIFHPIISFILSSFVGLTTFVCWIVIGVLLICIGVD